MKQSKYQGKKKIAHTDNKIEQKYYRAFIGLLIFFLVYGLFEPKYIGYDKRYSIYLFLLPTLIGMLIIGIYCRQFLINQFKSNNGFWSKTLIIIVYIILGFLLSYLSLGQVARISWNYLNCETVKQNSEETINCQITRFWTGRKPCVDFKFNNMHESLDVDYNNIKDYKDKNVNDYYLKIVATKGLWNYYKVDKWSIELRK